MQLNITADKFHCNEYKNCIYSFIAVHTQSYYINCLIDKPTKTISTKYFSNNSISKEMLSNAKCLVLRAFYTVFYTS